MVYRLPRMECILFAGINFDLRLDIPHNYVNKMCKKAFELTPTKVDALFEQTKSTSGKSQGVSDCIRYFLRFCLNSALCVEYPPDLIAAAALHYAVEVTGLASRPEYHSGWEQEVGLTEPILRAILSRRKEISECVRRHEAKRRSVAETGSPLTPRGAVVRDRNHSSESEAKRVRMEVSVSRPTVSAQPAPALHKPSPIPPTSAPTPLISAPAPLVSVPAPLTSTPAPLIAPIPLHSASKPSSSTPQPLIPSTPLPLVPQPLTEVAQPLLPVDSQSSNIPLTVVDSQSSNTPLTVVDSIPTPLFSASASTQPDPLLTVPFGLYEKEEQFPEQM